MSVMPPALWGWCRPTTLAPSDLEGRGMEAGLGPVANGVDEHQGVGPAGGLEASPEPTISELPARQLAEFSEDLFLTVDLFVVLALGS